MNYYLKVLRNYTMFNGRARRSEYWYFTLFNLLIAFGAMFLDNIFGIALDKLGYGPIYLIYMFAVLLPSLAVAVRRLHDVGKTGWFIAIGLIPVIGTIWLLVILVTPGMEGPNKYGPDPKEILN